MDLVFRYNPEAEDVEIVSIVNGTEETVVDTVGSDVFASWVSAHNDKHDYVQRVDIEAKVQEQIDAALAEERATAEAAQAAAVEAARAEAAAEAAAANQE